MKSINALIVAIEGGLIGTLYRDSFMLIAKDVAEWQNASSGEFPGNNKMARLITALRKTSPRFDETKFRQAIYAHCQTLNN